LGRGEKIAITNEQNDNLKHHCEEKEGSLLLLSIVKHNLIFIERCENEFIESLFSAKLCVLITQIGLPQKKGCKEQRKKACNIRK
jgi:hypothetical protein